MEDNEEGRGGGLLGGGNEGEIFQFEASLCRTNYASND